MFVKQPQGVTGDSGDRVTLECLVDSNPPGEYTWIRNNLSSTTKVTQPPQYGPLILLTRLSIWSQSQPLKRPEIINSAVCRRASVLIKMNYIWKKLNGRICLSCQTWTVLTFRFLLPLSFITCQIWKLYLKMSNQIWAFLVYLWLHPAMRELAAAIR